MRISEGHVREVVLDASGKAAVRVTCPQRAIPSPGRYTLAWSPDDTDASLAAPLFPTEISDQGFLAGSPVPHSWEPGTVLVLNGPLGHGFSIPKTIRHLLLIAMGESFSRLIPFIRLSLDRNAAVALFTDCALPLLPTAVEVYPLLDLPGALAWADFIGIDLPIDALDSLRPHLDLQPGSDLPCQAQVLIYSHMPCGGTAECCACAVPGKRNPKLSCKDGPVFDLQDLKW